MWILHLFSGSKLVQLLSLGENLKATLRQQGYGLIDHRRRRLKTTHERQFLDEEGKEGVPGKQEALVRLLLRRRRKVPQEADKPGPSALLWVAD